MDFLSQSFLWALPLVAAPVVIHLFSRKQRDVVRWAAMEFLLSSAIPRRRFLRLKDLLLMLIRMAIVFAIVAALARPLVSAGWLGSPGPRDVILIVDNSLSTSRKAGNGTLFDKELDEAARLIHQLNAADMVRVMVASPAPEWLSDSPQSADGSTQASLVSRLREATPNQGSADIPRAVQAALKAEPAGKEMSRFITVVSDGQSYSWRPDATGEWAAILAMEKKARPPAVLRAVTVSADSARVSNLAVEKITAPRAVAGIGQSVTLTATVKNTGTVGTDATPLSWRAGDQSMGLSTVPALEPGAETTIALSQPFPSIGLMDISCKLGGQDDLPLDDSAHFLLDVTESVPVLVVEGETQNDVLQSDSAYFLAALGWTGNQAQGLKPIEGYSSVFKPKLIGYQHFADEPLTSYQCVVLANVPRLSDEMVQRLSHYVSAGGSVWMALGDQTEIAAFNREFYQQSAGLSPVSIREPVGDAGDHEKFTAVAPPSADNPATALLADTHRLDIDRVRIYRRHQFDIGYDRSITVMLRAEGGAPLVVEKNFGHGRVIVQAVPLNVSWCNLPLCHSFVVMVQEWLWHLTESGLIRRNLQPGEPMTIAQSADSSTGSASVDSPGGLSAQLVGHADQDRMVFSYAKTLYPGEYKMNISGSKLPPEKFLVNRDPEASSLTPLTDLQLASLRDSAGVGFGAEPFSMTNTQKVAAPPKALASWLLAGLAALMVVEAIFAFALDKKRISPVSDAVLQPFIRS